MKRKATHGEHMTMLSVLFMGVWAAFFVDAFHSGVGWGKGSAAAVLALFGAVLLWHNAAWAVGYKVPAPSAFIFCWMPPFSRAPFSSRRALTARFAGW